MYDPYDTGSLAFRDYHARMANEIISVSMAHTHPLYSVMEGESQRSFGPGSVWLIGRVRLATIVLQYHWMHEAL